MGLHTFKCRTCLSDESASKAAANTHGFCVCILNYV